MDDKISKNWRTQGLPTGNYYASLANKWAYFYVTECITKNTVVDSVYSIICQIKVLFDSRKFFSVLLGGISPFLSLVGPALNTS